MPSTVQIRIIAWLILVIAALGTADALAGGDADLAAVLGLLLALGVVLVARTSGRRRPVAVRSDLVRWMEGRAAVGGERIDDVADRAIGAYRAGIVGDTGEPPDA